MRLRFVTRQTRAVWSNDVVRHRPRWKKEKGRKEEVSTPIVASTRDQRYERQTDSQRKRATCRHKMRRKRQT